MFFFMKDEVWRQYMDELGIRKTIDHLKEKGLPANWPTGVVDPSGYGVCYLPEGKPWYKSQCCCYEGYYIHGHIGTVRCRTAGELIPGIVWDNVCSKEYRKCPFYKEHISYGAWKNHISHGNCRKLGETMEQKNMCLAEKGTGK